MNKKAIAILGAIFLLIVGTLGFLIFQKYASKDTSKTSSSSQTATTTDSTVASTTDAVVPPVVDPQTTNSSGLVKLSQEQVLSPVLFFDGSGVAYFTSAGQLVQADFSTGSPKVTLERRRTLDVPVKSSIAKIDWPLVGRNFMAESNSLGKKVISYFNNQTGLYTDLPDQITSFDWNSTGDKIFYLWVQNGKATLNTADPDTKNWKKIADMWETDNRIVVSPNSQNILFFRTSSSDAINAIKLVTPDGKLWRELVKDGYNFGALWSPDSQKFVFGKKDVVTQKYGLWYYDLLTGETKSLGISTIPEKVTWSPDSKVIYAAVPSVGNAGSGSLTQDVVVRIDTATLERKEFSGFSQQVDVQDLFLSKDLSKLFFKNGQDGMLYYLDISK